MGLKFWVQRSDGVYVKYEGMEQAVIDAMHATQGMTATYITEAEWQVVAEGTI